MLFVCFLHILLAVCAHARIDPTETYIHSATLRSGTIRIYWKFNETHIVFEVHGQTTGWVGIGLSPNGAMAGADIYIGWVKNGTTNVTDRHGNANGFPPLDPEQNIVVLAGNESGGWTMFKFSRPLAKCEETYDREITADTQRLIYAWGNDDPTGNDVAPANHGTTNRGAESMHFLQSTKAPIGLPSGPNYTTIDLLSQNFTIPPEATYYNCRLFKLPTLGKKHHIVKMEPVIEKGNELNIHHILVYRCGDVLQNEAELGVNARCHTPNMQHFKTCAIVVGGWAIGGGAFFYPDEAGFSIGADGDPVYIQLEIHYDNPSLTVGKTDNSGIRFTYTDTLRENDVGILLQGTRTNPIDFIIPPGAERFQTTGHCTPFCINPALDGAAVENITIFAVLLHSHLSGRSLRLRHVRNGVELPYLASDVTYDFNFQEFRYLHSPAVLKKGDSLRMECVYNTKGRTNVTVGGLGTSEEMCLSFSIYYPKVDLAHCLSAASHEYTWPRMGLNLSQIQPQPITRYKIENLRYENQTVFDYFNQIPWTEEKIIYFQNINNIEQYEMCVLQNRTIKRRNAFNVTDIETPYIPPQRHCPNAQSTTTRVAETSSNGVSTRSAPLSSASNSVTDGNNPSTTRDGVTVGTDLSTTSKGVTTSSYSVSTVLIAAAIINMM